jgi:uncharacterized protein
MRLNLLKKEGFSKCKLKPWYELRCAKSKVIEECKNNRCFDFKKDASFSLENQENILEVFLLIVSILVILVGLIGTALPMLPGIPLIYLGYVIWGLASGWRDYGATTMIILGVVTVASVLLDYYAGAAGAKKFGASTSGVIGAFLGAIFGIIFFNIPGLILGPFAGAVIGEMISGKKQSDVWRAGWGAFLGFLAGSLFKIIMGTILAIMFFYLIIF